MANKALLIANGTFGEASGLPPLNGPQHDLAVMKAALTDRNCGMFEEDDVMCCADWDRARLTDAIEDFLKPTKRDDFIFIYYSGHGIKPGAQLYLATSDTIESRASSTGLFSAQILEVLERKNRAERTVFVLDCCFSGSFDKGGAQGALADVFPGRWVLASSSRNKPSKDGAADEPSRFTKALAEALVDPGLTPNDDLGQVYLGAVFDRIAQHVQPRPEISGGGQGPIAIAQRRDAAVARRTHAYPELERLTQDDLVLRHEISVPYQEAQVIRHLSALLDLAGQQQNAQHQETVDTIRSFVADRMWTHGTTEAILTEIEESFSNAQLTRLSLVIPDSAGERLPWEYQKPSGPAASEWASKPLALRRGLAVERIVNTERKPPLPAAGGDPDPSGTADHVAVGEVLIAGGLASEASISAAATLRLDLASLGVTVNEYEPDRGYRSNQFDFIRGDWPSVVTVFADTRRSKDGSQVAQIRLAGTDEGDWLDAPQFYDDLGLAVTDKQRAPFRAVILETFTTEPGDDAQATTLEMAVSIACRGLGNVIFICHPPGFDGYPPGDKDRPIRTFAGHLIGALDTELDVPVTVPRAFFFAKQRLYLAFMPRCEQRFGVPGLCLPSYTEVAPTAVTGHRSGNLRAGPPIPATGKPLKGAGSSLDPTTSEPSDKFERGKT